MVALLLGVMLATWASFLVSSAAEELVIWPFVVVLAASGCWLLATTKLGRPSWLMLVTVAGWGVFLAKLFSQMLVVTPEGIWAGGSNIWGDWAGHVGYVANWLYGSNFPPQNPWYAGVRLSYPFLFDFTSALLVKLGLSLPWSLQLPGIVLGVALVVLLFKLGEKITGQAAVGAVAVAIFMLSGGLGWVYLKDGAREATHYYEKNIQWVNFVVSEMVPQRGILMGLVATLAIFLLWLEGRFFVSGVIAGLLPFFHTHSYLAIMAMAGFLFLLRPRKDWWWFFLVAGILALPQLAYFLPQVKGYQPGFVRWQPGWLAPVQNDNWVWFWFKNAGLMTVLIPMAWVAAWRNFRRLFWLYLPFVLIFIASNLWVFQPWENDNSKFLRFWYLASAILVADWLVKLAQGSFFRKGLAALFLVGVTVAGAIDAGSWLDFDKNKLLLWSSEEIDLALSIKNQTPPAAVFLTADSHNHWVVDLAGRKIVMGFRGWLWSWGLDYSQREADVVHMFQGGPQTRQLLAKYGVDYVIISPAEKGGFAANESYYFSRYPLLFDRFGQKVFDVRE